MRTVAVVQAFNLTMQSCVYRFPFLYKKNKQLCTKLRNPQIIKLNNLTASNAAITAPPPKYNIHSTKHPILHN